jgi:hypothetical protein
MSLLTTKPMFANLGTGRQHVNCRRFLVPSGLDQRSSRGRALGAVDRQQQSEHGALQQWVKPDRCYAPARSYLTYIGIGACATGQVFRPAEEHSARTAVAAMAPASGRSSDGGGSPGFGVLRTDHGVARGLEMGKGVSVLGVFATPDDRRRDIAQSFHVARWPCTLRSRSCGAAPFYRGEVLALFGRVRWHLLRA